MLERLGEWDALILHDNIWRAWIVPVFARGPRVQCGPSPRRSALPLSHGLVAGGRPIDLGDYMLERLGGGDASIIHFKSRRALLVSYFS